MGDKFNYAHKFTAKWEGGISDHPADRGGVTAYGASIAFIRDMAKNRADREFLLALGVAPFPVCRNTILALSRDQAKAIFRHEFWQKHDLDALPICIAALVYDAAVNCGPARGIRFAQQGANSLGAGLEHDGILGPLTRKALQKPDATLVRAIAENRRQFHRSIVKANPGQRVFLQGWLNRVNALENMLISDFYSG